MTSMLGLCGKFGLHRKKFGFSALLLAAVVVLASCNPGSLGSERGWSAPVVEDGLLYIGTRSGKLLALRTEDLRDGDVLELNARNLRTEWEFPRGDDDDLGAVYSTAVLSPDRVFIALNEDNGGDRVGRIVALYKKDDPEKRPPERAGDEIWSIPLEGMVFGSPILYEDRVYIADDEGFVYAFDANAGRSDDPFVWDEKVSDQRFWSTPTLSSDGILYIGGMDKRLYALDAKTGAPVWPEPFKAGAAITSTPLVLGDVVYVGAFDQKFYAVDRRTGDEIWAFKADGWFWNDAIANQDRTVIYVGSLGGSFYALNVKDGTQIERFPIGAKIRATSVLVGDLIYIVVRNGQVLRLNLPTGRISTVETLDAKALASPEWAEDSLYVSDLNQKLHRLAAPFSN